VGTVVATALETKLYSSLQLVITLFSCVPMLCTNVVYQCCVPVVSFCCQEKAIGTKIPDNTFSYSEQDAILYALGGLYY